MLVSKSFIIKIPEEDFYIYIYIYEIYKIYQALIQTQYMLVEQFVVGLDPNMRFVDKKKKTLPTWWRRKSKTVNIWCFVSLSVFPPSIFMKC